MKYLLLYVFILSGSMFSCINRSMDDVAQLALEKRDIIHDLYHNMSSLDESWVVKENGRIMIATNDKGVITMQNLKTMNMHDESSKEVIKKAFNELRLLEIREFDIRLDKYNGRILELRLKPLLNDTYLFYILVYHKDYEHGAMKDSFWPESKGVFVTERIAVGYYK